MVIFGTKLKLLVTQVLMGLTCAHCNTRDTVIAVVYQKIAHIFWMPVFSLGKTGATECSHCKQVLRETEMPAETRASYTEAKRTASAPWSAYWGLLVLAGLLLIGMFADKN